MEESQLISSGKPANLPAECKHENWTLGCERCFYEVTALAKGEVQAEDSRQAHEHTINGGVLFGWHLLTVLSDIELQLHDMSESTLDLKRRELATSVLKNIHNISAYVVGTCTDTRKMEVAIQRAAVLASEMGRRMEQERDTVTVAATAPASSIVLTDM